MSLVSEICQKEKNYFGLRCFAETDLTIVGTFNSGSVCFTNRKINGKSIVIALVNKQIPRIFIFHSTLHRYRDQ